MKRRRRIKMSDCGCDAPKYSGGWCYGMWSGLGCTTRGEMWDVNNAGDLVIRYYDSSFRVEFIQPHGSFSLLFRPLLRMEDIKGLFIRYGRVINGAFLDGRRFYIRGYVDIDVGELDERYEIVAVIDEKLEVYVTDRHEVKNSTEVRRKGKLMWSTDIDHVIFQKFRWEGEEYERS